ncbi:hypothetical protein [Larkinella rosea]|uniref:Uncharacterized protein n=1 Tax=Larkinella rosea TaxID=2025312 RepID=A0A3P1C2I2_9BACT|nr:hypothetical protein [Larkinella rosea]RRB07459.1 hypothetical protein EHT25_06675 [Larkinella rosea]
METYNPAEDENQGIASTMARHDSGTGEELEPGISPSGNLPSPDPDLTETTLFDEADEEDGLSSEE